MSADHIFLRFRTVAICAVMILLLTPAWAVTPSGTEIAAQAIANYTTTDGVPVETEFSNVATWTVQYPVGVSIGGAKKLTDGQFVELMNTVVIAGTPEMGGVFYIESPDRSTGIRVQTTLIVREGDLVTVSGVLATANGERQIDAADVSILSSGNSLPTTLYLAPAWSRNGVSPTGLLARMFGRITAAPSGAAYFYLDDGSALKDGSGYTGVRVYGITPSNPVGRLVSVVGIPGVETYGQGTIRVIRTRRSADILPIPGAP
jgi:hypothetical protein